MVTLSIGGFDIVRALGDGAFGRVFLAKHRETGLLRALKVLRGSPPSGSPQHRALQNEIALAPRIRHENVVRVFGSGNDPVFGEYLEEEFVDGTNLRALIDTRPENPHYSNAREMMRAIANGLMAINGMMIHRDVHPGNILLDGTTPKITDFGLAKLVDHETRTETFKGIQHIAYKAPEGWKFEHNSILLDVYSTGLVFFEILTGTHPLELRGRILTSEDWRDAHLFGDRPRLRDVRTDIPPAVSALISEMMAIRRENRPSWEYVLDVLDHDHETPSWLRLSGDAGRRADEASARRRALLSRFETEQEYHYRATCNRFLCLLEDLVDEARDHLKGPIIVTRTNPNEVRFEQGGELIICRLFGRFKGNCMVEVGFVLGGGYLEGAGSRMNIVTCSTGDDDLGGEWWVFPTDAPTSDEATFYAQVTGADGGELSFTAHAVRGFSLLLHRLFIH